MLHRKLKALAEERPGAALLQIKRDGQWVRYSRREVYVRAKALAAHLARLGVRPRDHVVLFADNGPEWVIAYLGIHLAGCAVVPIDAQYSQLELRVLVPFVDAKVALTTTTLRDTIAWGEIGVERVLLIDAAAGSEGILRLPEAPAEFQPVELGPDSVMSLIFTSGTTGDPKCAMLTCGNFVSNAQAVLQMVDVTEQDNILSILPLHHCYAFTGTVLAPLWIGGTTTFETTLKGPAIIEAMRETGVTVMEGVPQLYAQFERRIFERAQAKSWPARLAFGRLLALSRLIRRRLGVQVGRYLFASIRKTFGPRFRFFVSGGAKLDPQIIENLTDLGLAVMEGYGLTETAPILTLTPPGPIHPTTVGRPVPGVEIRIRKPDGEGVGEIIARGPNVMKGYYANPEATAEMIRDGWLHTGDLGFIDSDGFLTITGRAKEVIVMSSGKNVYPEEVEKHYLASRFIAEVCVFGVGDSPGGASRLAALVVPNFEELRRADITRVYDEIKWEINSIANHVPSYMRLAEFRVVAQPLPRTRLGKLKRSAIRVMKFEDFVDGQPPRPELTPEDRALLEKPSAGRFLTRLAGLTGYEKPILPGDSLELDLGLDSLSRVELSAILEQEFGTAIPAEQSAEIMTVRDVLRRLPGDGGPTGIGDPGGGATWSWVKEPPDPPFEQRYPLHDRAVDFLLIDPLRFVARYLFKWLFKLRIEGVEKLPWRGPMLLCPNHQSLLDAVLLHAMLPAHLTHRMWSFALASYFSTPPLSWFVRLLRIIPTGTERTTRSSMQYAYQALKNGFALCLFPEGERSADGGIQDGRIGVGVLACETGTPIYAVRIFGAMHTLSRTSPGLHRADIRLVVGPRVDPPRKESYADADYRAVAAAWRQAVEGIA